jgi:hypothetical protein
LRRDGIDARLELFERSPPQGWPLWCARQILDSNYGLPVCTKSCRGASARFIPFFTSSDESHIPETDRFTATSKVDGLRPLISNRLIVETRHQHGTPQDTSR